MSPSWSHKLVCSGADSNPELKSGECSVEGDGRCDVYRIRKGDRAAFKRWYANALNVRCTMYRVVGAWPRYYTIRLGG